MKHISQTPRCLMNYTLRCYMFRSPIHMGSSTGNSYQTFEADQFYKLFNYLLVHIQLPYDDPVEVETCRRDTIIK
jgi:hypothetical protein